MRCHCNGTMVCPIVNLAIAILIQCIVFVITVYIKM